MKGLIIDVFYNNTYRHCANGGISENNETLLLVGPDVPEIFEDDGIRPMVTIETVGGREYLYPVDRDNNKRYTSGGSFGYTCDSRVLPIPLKIHDRTE